LVKKQKNHKESLQQTKKETIQRLHGWEVTFTDGHKVRTGYKPNPRMAVGEAMKQHKGTVKTVKYI